MSETTGAGDGKSDMDMLKMSQPFETVGADVDKPLHKLLEAFQSNLSRHLGGKRLDDAQLDKVTEQVFQSNRNNANNYINSVQDIVSDLTSVAHNWREHKNELARKIPLIYISIACIGQCSAIFDRNGIVENGKKEVEQTVASDRDASTSVTTPIGTVTATKNKMSVESGNNSSVVVLTTCCLPIFSCRSTNQSSTGTSPPGSSKSWHRPHSSRNKTHIDGPSNPFQTASVLQVVQIKNGVDDVNSNALPNITDENAGDVANTFSSQPTPISTAFQKLVTLLQATADLLNCFKDEIDAIW